MRGSVVVSSSRQIIDGLLLILGEHRADLRAHVDGVAQLAAQTAERLGLDPREVERIGIAAELHDIGKVAIPDLILDKPGPLSAAEWDFMRQHTVIGERILLAVPSLAPSAGLVRSSHERFDGAGYPDGLRHDEIPLGASIIAVCDAYDAMISARPYSGPMSPDEALTELSRCAGSQFHPGVVATLCALVLDRELALASV